MKKDKFLKIRISKEEDDKLRKLAADRNMKVSKFVRERIFAEYVKIPVVGKVK